MVGPASETVWRAWNHAARRRLNGGGFEWLDRDAILAAGGGACHICGQPVDPRDWHVDHIIALANGGDHAMHNVAPAHPECNMHKGAVRVARRAGRRRVMMWIDHDLILRLESAAKRHGLRAGALADIALSEWLDKEDEHAQTTDRKDA